MKLLSLKFKNLRSFQEADIDFGKCNHITGQNLDNADNNGTGKTTIIQAILLLLGGSKLVNIKLNKFIRDNEKSANIQGMLEINGDILEITRTLKSSGTSTLKLLVNGKDPECKTSKDYQNYLFDYIGDTDNFKKFRLLDASNGINILDFTSGQLRKTLMGMCQDKFDIIRANLLNKKNYFEKYNKDAVINKHAPSEKRLTILQEAIKAVDTSELNKLVKKIQEFQMDKNKLLTEKGKIEQTIDIKKRQIAKLKSLGTCPSCFQIVSDEHKQRIEKELSSSFGKLKEKISNISNDISMYNDILADEEKQRTKIYAKKQKLTSLKYKLDTRLSQKEYKYTKEDVELAKKAIEVIDEFANYYVIEWINTIEPIVNSYICKLNMFLHFKIDEKGNLEIIIERGQKNYTYDQLSQGEKIFISSIFKIALLLEQQEQGCMFADESFDCLSYENLERLINIVSELPIQLFFVTHQANFYNLNAKTIFIQKKNSISTIKSKESLDD